MAEMVKYLLNTTLLNTIFFVAKIYPAGIVFSSQPALKVGVANNLYLLPVG